MFIKKVAQSRAELNAELKVTAYRRGMWTAIEERRGTSISLDDLNIFSYE